MTNHLACGLDRVLSLLNRCFCNKIACHC